MNTTRADGPAISQTPTRLLVLDVVDGTVKQTLERTTATVQDGSTVLHADNVLEELSLSLTYGTHDIYILAAYKAYDTFSTSDKTVTWSTSTDRLSYTWAKKVTVEVGTTTAAAQAVELPLVVGQIALVCQDAQPTGAAKMKIEGELSWTLDLTTMQGQVPSEALSFNIDIPANTPKNYAFSAYTFIPSSGKIESLTFTALKSDETQYSTTSTHTLIDVPVSAGYISQYKGLFYSNTQGLTLSTTNQWTDVNHYTY